MSRSDISDKNSDTLDRNNLICKMQIAFPWDSGQACSPAGYNPSSNLGGDIKTDNLRQKVRVA